MTKRALITGIAGMDGYWVSKLLYEMGYEVHGLIRRGSLGCLKHLPQHYIDEIKLHSVDITDAYAVNNVMYKVMPDEIYHLAAFSSVGDSWENPDLTYHTNLIGTLNILNGMKARCPEAYMVFTGCHDTKTRIATRRGLLSYAEVKIGDLVLSLNMQTGETEECKVRQVHVYDYSGDMVAIRNRSVNQLLTPNHKILLSNSGGMKLELAEDVYARKKRAPTNSRDYLPVGIVPDANPSEELLELSDVVSVPKNSYNTKRNLSVRYNKSDLFYLMGLYIGDGYTKSDKSAIVGDRELHVSRRDAGGRFKRNSKFTYKERATYVSNYIQFAIPEADKSRAELEATLVRMGIVFNAHPGTVDFSSVPLRAFFKLSGSCVYDKKIPEALLSASKEHLRHLLRGLIGSDGYEVGGAKLYYTVSKILSEQVAYLAEVLGYHARVTLVAPRKATINGARIISTRESYTIRMSTKPRRINGADLDKIPHTGKVWCLEVADNHNFLIARDGIYAFSGNSSEMFGSPLENPQTELTPFNPVTPYGISKAAAYQTCRSYRDAYNLNVSMAISYNHDSFCRPTSFALAKICQGAAYIKRGMIPSISLGNVDVARDFGYAADFAKAYINMACMPPDEYVLAAGKLYSLRQACNYAFAYAGVQINWVGNAAIDRNAFIRIQLGQGNLRPIENKRPLVGDSSKAQAAGVFAITKDFEEIIQEMVEFHLTR